MFWFCFVGVVWCVVFVGGVCFCMGCDGEGAILVCLKESVFEVDAWLA